LGIRKNQIEILSGHASREKIVCVVGLTPQEVEARLALAAPRQAKAAGEEE
jgi:uncharacterized protein YggU (UPF0235/DUF167 family)